MLPSRLPEDDVNPERHLRRLCEDFQHAWSCGERPRIVDFIACVDDAWQAQLFARLIALDVDFRSRAGEEVKAAIYHELCLATPDIVTKAIEDGKRQCESRSTSLPSNETDHGHHQGSVPFKREGTLGDYTLEDELGRGGMGIVYRARHQELGTLVALKVLPRVDGPSLHKFKQEFRSLSHVSHPQLIGLHQLASDGECWFFTMDLIDDAVPFIQYVRPTGRLDEKKLRAVFPQLLAGVAALHARQIVHRDLKPSNVLIDRDGNLKILDFGLVLDAAKAAVTFSETGIAGTPAYMAPEQAQGKELSGAADWYAVGVMLHEALTGRRPFEGTLLEVITKKTTEDLPPLSVSMALVDLASLCQQLLDRDPKRRPNSDDLGNHSAIALGLSAVKTETSERRLVDRERQLVELHEAYNWFLAHQRPLVAMITGRSGEGKTVLAEHFLGTIRDLRRVAFVSGRCYERESLPFKALDSLIDGLSGYLRSLSATEARSLLPQEIGLLAKLFPVLNRIGVIAHAPVARLGQLDEQQVRTRAFAVLRELLLRISNRDPIVAFVDDLQWGDADSAEVLAQVLRSPGAPMMLFVGAYRSDEATHSPFLNKWNAVHSASAEAISRRTVQVGPLPTDACVDLAVNLLGEDTPFIREVAHRCAVESSGNAFLLSEFLESLDRRAHTLSTLPLSAIVHDKLNSGPPLAAQVLQFVAVSGRSIPSVELARLVGVRSLDPAALNFLRNQRLLRVVGSSTVPRLDTYHDRIRETILNNLDHSQRRLCHLRIAETIESFAGDTLPEEKSRADKSSIDNSDVNERAFDLAYHYDAAGIRNKALGYALAAAEQARSQFALEAAVSAFEMAERNLGPDDRDVRYDIGTKCGHCLTMLGRYEQAAHRLQGVAELTDDEEGKALVDLLQGDLAFKRGHVHESQQLLEQGLRRLRIPVPRSTSWFLLSLVGQLVNQLWHTLTPGRRHRRHLSHREQLAVRLFEAVTMPYTFRSTPKMLWANLSAMNVSERGAYSPILSRIYGVHGGMTAMMGWQSRASHYCNLAADISQEFNDTGARGYSLNYAGVGLYASARFAEAVEVLTEAIEATEQGGGNLYEIHLARFHKGSAHFGLGDFIAANDEVMTAFPSAARGNESRTMCLSWLLARLTLGNFPFDRLQCYLPHRPDDVMSTVHALLAESLWHSYHQRSNEALQRATEATTIVRENACINSHTVLVLPSLARAQRERAFALSQSDKRQANMLARRSLKSARWGARIARFFPAAYPVALRELSHSYSSMGNSVKALRYAEKSCQVAEHQQAKYEFAESNLLLARLKHALNGVGSREEAQSAYGLLEPFRQMALDITMEVERSLINKSLSQLPASSSPSLAQNFPTP